MAIVTVTFNGIRVDDSTSKSDWEKFDSGGKNPTAEPQLAYQGGGAVNKKITSKSNLQGIACKKNSNVNMSQASNKLFFVKCIVSDSFDLNDDYGVSISIGTNKNRYYSYNVAGLDSNLSVYNSYIAQGGYLITAINPNIVNWRSDTKGSPDLTAVRYYGLRARFVNGDAKTENVVLDAIDVGTGLTLIGGDDDDVKASYYDFLRDDQNIKSNRWGVVTGSATTINAIGKLEIGNASGNAVGFKDESRIVIFKNGYHSADSFGVNVILNNAMTSIIDNALLISQGSINSGGDTDTRADYTVTGSIGFYNSSAQIRNFRKITYSSACAISNADIECQSLVQNSCAITNSIIRTNSLTSEACLLDSYFDFAVGQGGIYNCEFVQSGFGHAIEIANPLTIDMWDIKFNGYGENDTNSSAIKVSAESGTVTINVRGGNVPTYTSAGATVVIANPVVVSVKVLNSNGVAVSGARVYLTTVTDDVVISGLTNANGHIENAQFYFEYDTAVTGKVRKGSVVPFYKSAIISGIITESGLSIVVYLVSDA